MHKVKIRRIIKASGSVLILTSFFCVVWADEVKVATAPRAETKIQLGQDELTVSMADLEQMKSALEAYPSKVPLASTPKELRAYLKQNLRKNQIGIDDDGGHIGAWILEASKTGPILSLRPAPDAAFRFVARLQKSGNSWTVSKIIFQMITRLSR